MDHKQQTRSGMIPSSWQHRMKLQFFFKASKAYYVLSEAATNLLKYGRALRYIKLSLQCHGEDLLDTKTEGTHKSYLNQIFPQPEHSQIVIMNLFPPFQTLTAP